MTSTTIYIEHIHQSCVYLITYSGGKLPHKFKKSTISPNKYIGSGSVEKIFDGYRGSVSSKKYKKIWKQELDEHPYLFHLEFLSFHDDRKDAFEEETRVQREIGVVRSEEYVNLTIGKSLPIRTHQTTETRNKISITKKKNMCEETKQKISKIHLNKIVSEDTRHNMRLSHSKTKRAVGGNNSNSKPTIFNGILYSCKKEAILASGLSEYLFNKLPKTL
jgi:hypothetical protein